MYGINDDMGGQQGEQGMDTGDQWVGRVMSAEYNLAQQQGRPVQAGAILGQMFGQFLNRRFGGS